MRRVILSVSFFVALVVLSAIADPAQASVTTTGDVSPGGTGLQGRSQNRARGIDGSNIVGWYEDDDGRNGFLFDGTNYTTIDYPKTDPSDYINTRAYGVDGIDSCKVVGSDIGGKGAVVRQVRNTVLTGKGQTT